MATDAAIAPICEECGYNLTGLSSRVCPECGRAFEIGVARASWVPWVRRKQVGWLRAYLSTIWQVVVRPQRFRREAAFGGPMARRSARSFRNVTAWLAGASTAAVFAADMLQQGLGTVPLPLAILYAFTAAIITTLSVIGAIECVPAYMLRPSEERARPYAAAALLYACAPLVLSPLVAIALIVSAWRVQGWHEFEPELWAWLTIPALMAVWWLVSVRLTWTVLDRPAGRLFALAIILPIAWMLMAAIWLIGIVGVGVAITWGIRK